jgi:transcription initiation factor IIF auxiliary subunit
MSEFFESEIVQEELNEINRMQQEVCHELASFGSLSSEDKKEHIQRLRELLSKQQIMYTRVSLSDDPLAVQMKEQLQQSVQLMGFPPNTDMQILFDGMSEIIDNLKQFVD